MGLGVLPDRHLSDVPGTSFLNEKGVSSTLEDSVPDNHANLKHDPSGKIVLVPQPADDPNDPLNWPRWKKEMFTISYVFGCGAVGAVGPLLAPATVPLAEEFDVPIQTFVLGFSGSLIVCLAFGNLLCNSFAMMIGKRPVYLITTVGLLVTCIWGAVAKDFASLSVSRAIQGFCISPMEALIPASISDVWFVHQRGFRNALFNLGVLGGINLAAPIAGAIIDKYGYRTSLWGMAGAFGLQLVLTFFFMPETVYKRRDTTDVPMNSVADENSAMDDKKESVCQVENSASIHGSTSIPQKHSLMYELRPWSGYYDSSGFWYSILAPFKMLGSPVVVWGCFELTICMSWLVMLANTVSQIFTGPPYNFTVAQVGLTSLSSFMGTLIATALAGLFVDGLAKFMARKNQGIYEPEFRLPILALLAALSVTGFFGWGQSLQNAEPWPIPVIVCLGMINLGIQFGIVGVVSYVVDSHRHEAVEAYAAMSFTRNMFTFGMTFYMNNWLIIQGVRDTFFVVGGITTAVLLATIPMYIYGKRARSFAFRHGLLK
ncbi:transporter HOL1 [Fusarium beomiforme]|uniref:Transporter HOL1 n=1 Tax=Fusarium beomiforme TaxID=44412 RepID=A0A9P5A9F5_9HYPO|nr:transporter HOL1 [Fusarium beomiforme]